MAEKNRFIVRVQGKQVEVAKEVYCAYYGMERHLLTLDEKDARNGKILYSNLDTADTLGEDMLPDREAVSVEDAAIALVLHDQLHRALRLLPASEQELIHAIYFRGLSERQLSEQVRILVVALSSWSSALFAARSTRTRMNTMAAKI